MIKYLGKVAEDFLMCLMIRSFYLFMIRGMGMMRVMLCPNQ